MTFISFKPVDDLGFGKVDRVEADLGHSCLCKALSQWLRMRVDAPVRLEDMLLKFNLEVHGGEFPA